LNLHRSRRFFVSHPPPVVDPTRTAITASDSSTATRKPNNLGGRLCGSQGSFRYGGGGCRNGYCVLVGI
jgi:hypothetical protein